MLMAMKCLRGSAFVEWMSKCSSVRNCANKLHPFAPNTLATRGEGAEGTKNDRKLLLYSEKKVFETDAENFFVSSEGGKEEPERRRGQRSLLREMGNSALRKALS